MPTITIPMKSAGDLTLPVLGLGCYFFGDYYRTKRSQAERDIKLIRHAHTRGVRHFDTPAR